VYSLLFSVNRCPKPYKRKRAVDYQLHDLLRSGILQKMPDMKSLRRLDAGPVLNYLLVVLFYIALFFAISVVSRNIQSAKAEQVHPAVGVAR